MKNRIKHSGFLLVIVLTGCATHKTVSTTPTNKRYSWNPVYGVASSIYFDSDSTFTYDWVTGLIRGGSEGTWLQYNDTIALNSHRQPLQPLYLNQEIRDQNYISLKTRNFRDSLDIPFVKVKAIMGDSMVRGYTNEFGELILKLPNVDTLTLNSLEFGSRIIACSPSANHFDIWLVNKPLNYEPYTFFTNSIWILEEKSIYQDSLQRKFVLNKRKQP